MVYSFSPHAMDIDDWKYMLQDSELTRILGIIFDSSSLRTYVMFVSQKRKEWLSARNFWILPSAVFPGDVVVQLTIEKQIAKIRHDVGSYISADDIAASFAAMWSKRKYLAPMTIFVHEPHTIVKCLQWYGFAAKVGECVLDSNMRPVGDVIVHTGDFYDSGGDMVRTLQSQRRHKVLETCTPFLPRDVLVHVLLPFVGRQ